MQQSSAADKSKWLFLVKKLQMQQSSAADKVYKVVFRNVTETLKYLAMSKAKFTAVEGLSEPFSLRY